MNFDKIMLERIFSQTGIRESRDMINKILTTSRNDEKMQMMLAIFRDIFMFKDLCYGVIHRQDMKIHELSCEIEELKKKVGNDV